MLLNIYCTISILDVKLRNECDLFDVYYNMSKGSDKVQFIC